MNAEAQATPEPTRRINERIAFVLHVARGLIAYARHFTAAERVAIPEIAMAAAIFGTCDLAPILFRMRRGILRALALERYLLDLAARGRTLRFHRPDYLVLLPHHHPPAQPPGPKRAAPASLRRKDPSLLGPDDPRAYCMPTEAELDARVRRSPVGRTITYICPGLGVLPNLFESSMWGGRYAILRGYRGNLHRLYELHDKRQVTFQRERDRMPDTWHIEWRVGSKEIMRKVLGCLIGEEPPDFGLPVIVPS
jgi:hypothetical protein